MFCCVKLVNLSNIIYSFFGTEKTKRIQCEQQLSSNLAFVKKAPQSLLRLWKKEQRSSYRFVPVGTTIPFTHSKGKQIWELTW